jgi:SNF2 family DNA or RNA helicase
VIADGELSLQVGADRRSVSAARIFACEYRGVCEWDGIQVDESPSRAIPGLTVERALCDLGLDVFVPAAPSEEVATVALHLRCRDSFVSIQRTPLNGVDHCLVDGRWFAFARGDLAALESVLGGSLTSTSKRITLAQVVRLRLTSDLSLRWFRIANSRRISLESERAPDWGDVLSVPPFRYQERGLAWLARLVREEVGGLLADEMGLGKTLQAIGVIAWRRRTGRIPCLVVTPTSLVENWRREFAKFAPQVPILIHQGAMRTGAPTVLLAAECVITTYDCLVRDEALFQAVSWDVVILDEAQYIKNPGSLRARAAVALPRRVGVAMTGTPLENHLLDLWSIFEFAVPGLLGSQVEFERMAVADSRASEVVADTICPFMLRRRLAEVKRDMPRRHEVVTPISLDSEQAVIYESIRTDAVRAHGRAPSLASLTALRQFCGHPWLVTPRQGDPVACSLKLQRLLDLLEAIRRQGERALVFAPFQALLDLLSGVLARRLGADARVIDGRTPVVERQLMIDAFSECPGFDVLLLNPRAAGVGLNITAANHVIHFCPEWNPAVMDQATARAHRTGQRKDVTVHRLYLADTVEEVMETRLALKRRLIGEVVQDNDSDPLSPADIATALNASPLGRRL